MELAPGPSDQSLERDIGSLLKYETMFYVPERNTHPSEQGAGGDHATHPGAAKFISDDPISQCRGRCGFVARPAGEI